MHMLLLLVMAILSQSSDVKIPRLKDETSLLKLKADAAALAGKPLVLCGGIEIGDYYNFSYRNAQQTHYSLRFTEIGDEAMDRGETCHLYLEKTRDSEKLVADLIASADKKKARHSLILARVVVYIHPDRYKRDKEWDLLELADVQFATPDMKSWLPWTIATMKKARETEDKARDARLKVIRDLDMALESATAKEFEAKMWREWTDASGKKFEAKYSGIVSGKLKLVTRDGKKQEVSFDSLTKEEKEWTQKKPWVRPKAGTARPAKGK